ncbi:MAG: hypothetical protein RLZZ369_1749, partial [Pseudomonadota bacterium]
TQFEQEIIAKNINDVGNTASFFNVLYGDFAMRSGDFERAKTYYEKGSDFSGIPLSEGIYDYNTGEYVKIADPSKVYNGFNNISSLIFGHNHLVSYGSPENEMMKAEQFVSEFPFIKANMNKLELSSALLQLKKVAAGKDEKAAKANQLIGNLLYNTSALGYYRQVFVMDMGEAVRIADLARELIRMTGHTEAEIPIVFSGLRPGEKLYEELLADADTTLPTPHPRLRLAQLRGELPADWIDRLMTLATDDAAATPAVLRARFGDQLVD